MKNQDLFKDKSQNWDKGNVQTSTASNIANNIKTTVKLDYQKTFRRKLF